MNTGAFGKELNAKLVNEEDARACTDLFLLSSRPAGLASGNRRTDYVAVSNTVIGVLLLAVGSIGVLTPLIGFSGVLLLLAGTGVAGAFLCLTLQEA